MGLVGGWEPLFSALAREARITAGCITVHGHPAERAVPAGVVGLALNGPGLPTSWTALEYLRQSARLAGVAGRHARAEALAALEQTGTRRLATKKISRLVDAERRVLHVVHAVLGSPPVVAIQTPLAKLEAAAQRYVAEVIERAAAGRCLLVSVPSAPANGPELSLLSGMDELLLLEGGELVAQGSPTQVLAKTPRYLVVVPKRAPQLVAGLQQLGLRVDVVGAGTHAGPDPPEAAPHAPITEAAHLVVHLGEAAQTDVILDTALAAGAPILQLVPLR